MEIVMLLEQLANNAHFRLRPEDLLIQNTSLKKIFQNQNERDFHAYISDYYDIDKHKIKNVDMCAIVTVNQENLMSTINSDTPVTYMQT